MKDGLRWWLSNPSNKCVDAGNPSNPSKLQNSETGETFMKF
jgi:hypothetical protein